MARITITVWRCGRCGRPRGMHHLCPGGRRGRDRIGLSLSFTCPSCGRNVPSLIAHTCSVRSDFRKRKAAQRRAAQAAERKNKRRATAARKRARRKEGRRRAAERSKQLAAETAARRKAQQRQRTHDKDRHDYETCKDPYCSRFGCKVFREGREAGRAEGHADGYSQGFADGLSADPSSRPLKSKGGFW